MDKRSRGLSDLPVENQNVWLGNHRSRKALIPGAPFPIMVGAFESSCLPSKPWGLAEAFLAAEKTSGRMLTALSAQGFPPAAQRGQ